MADPFIAEIIMFGGNFAPRGWAFCEGQLLPISSNTALFTLLGTVYGGDGRTTFALPDLRGRVPVQPGSGPGLTTINLGERSGTNSNVLTVNNLPSHGHAAGTLVMRANTAGSNTEDPTGASFGETPINLFNGVAADTSMATGTIGGNTANVGANQAINNMQPFLGINFIIAMTGIFPSRN